MAIKKFIDYIVNNDSNKYPSDGLHTDGYYYEAISGANVTIGGVKVKDDLNLVSGVTDLSVSTLPYGSN